MGDTPKTATVRPQRYELTPIGEVRPHPDNAKLGDVGAIGASIDRSGFYGAVVVQRSTGYILVGNHRWRAAADKGLSELPVIFVDCDADEARRIMVADNRTSDLGEYDTEKLVALLSGFDGDLAGSGYDDDDLRALLSTLEEPDPSMPRLGDERYTPAWIFDGMGLRFDLDVAAPVDESQRRVPADRHLTVFDDGLTAPWDGLVWMNPPYSNATEWVCRWAQHPDGVCLSILSNTPRMTSSWEAADLIALVPTVDFDSPVPEQAGISLMTFMAARGAGTPGLERLAESHNWPTFRATPRPRVGDPLRFGPV